MQLAPIALFVYNRPYHTRKTLESLIGNPEFEDSLLYVFCDGARSEKDKESVLSTRELIHSYELENAIIVESEPNKGLAKSIVEGVNHILQEHERIIVLEDDCVPTTDFLYFMNACLSYYESDEQIMNVSGYAPPIEIPKYYPYDIYFSYRSSSWGWGTWKRAWKYYSNDPSILEIIESSSKLKNKVDRAGLDLYPMLRRQVYGKTDSWAVFWSLSIIMNDGLCIFPVESRILNIGNDNSGTHCSYNEKYDVQVCDKKRELISFPESIILDKKIINTFYNFYAGSLFKKLMYICYHKVAKHINFEKIKY